MPDADPIAAGSQPATIGTTAFASLNAALAAYSATNTGIIVNAGNYSEAALVNVSGVDITFQGTGVTFSSLADSVNSASLVDRVRHHADGRRRQHVDDPVEPDRAAADPSSRPAAAS